MFCVENVVSGFTVDVRKIIGLPHSYKILLPVIVKEISERQ